MYPQQIIYHDPCVKYFINWAITMVVRPSTAGLAEPTSFERSYRAIRQKPFSISRLALPLCKPCSQLCLKITRLLCMINLRIFIYKEIVWLQHAAGVRSLLANLCPSKVEKQMKNRKAFFIVVGIFLSEIMFLLVLLGTQGI